MNDPRILPAQFGFGFTESGMPRLPDNVLPDALRILDDAMMPKQLPHTEAIGKLAHQCANGCFFDFERKPTRMHAAIIRRLSQELRGLPLFAAERFMPMCTFLLPLVTPPQRCGNWKRFAAQTGERYPNGWALELIPGRYSVQMPFIANSSGKITDALCYYRQEGKTAQYFDTSETLSEKLAVARANGCCAAIGLLEELRPLLQAEHLPFFK